MQPPRMEKKRARIRQLEQPGQKGLQHLEKATAGRDSGNQTHLIPEPRLTIGAHHLQCKACEYMEYQGNKRIPTHRYPFSLVDMGTRADLEAAISAPSKNVFGHEPFFMGIPRASHHAGRAYH